MTNGQNQGDGMPDGGMNSGKSQDVQFGRQCVAPPMKITLTIEIGEGASALKTDGTSDAKKQLADLDKA